MNYSHILFEKLVLSVFWQHLCVSSLNYIELYHERYENNTKDSSISSV